MSSDSSYLLSIAGVNIYKVYGDTTQLSTRRGGSLLLREAIKTVADTPQYALEAISTGASEGLFEFQAATNKDATDRRDAVAESLNSHFRYSQLTFVVDVEPIGDAGFNPAKEAVLARNRCRQFQQPTLALPGWNDDKVAGPCAWDNLRPMVDEGQWVKRVERGQPDTSLSVVIRHDYGREKKKRDFIEAETGLKGITVTDDLQQIASAPEFGNLDDKLAVLYFDGNAFSRILRGCADRATHRDFDETIQGYRRDFLTALVERARADRHFTTASGALRLEVLLWGGDEMVLVVPAWQGFAVMQFFYQQSRGWTFEVDTKEGGKKKEHRLTHAGGLVFCQVKTPIQHMQTLATELADTVKASKGGRDGNRFDYFVLESIDSPGDDPAAIRLRRYDDQLSEDWQPLHALPDWDQRAHHVADLLADLPRRQLYRVAGAARSGEQLFEIELQRLKDLYPAAALERWQQQLEGLFPGCVEHPRWLWLHLAELADYLTPNLTLACESADTTPGAA